MKIHTHDSAFAFLLVAIAVPTVLIGVLTVSAASELSPIYKSTSHELFDLQSFRSLRRMIHQDAVPSVEVAPESHPAATSSEQGIEDDVEEKSRPLIFEDLDMLKREELRKQLRVGGCPQEAAQDYKELCESMLKKQNVRETMTGLRHPQQ